MAENLPKSIESHDQEVRSLKKLNSMLSEKKFIIREESGVDYGVDRILELKYNSCVTNFRTHLQIKDVMDGLRLKDGTFSYSVSVAGINYLMNQPSSLFVIYLENEDILLWAWASDIFESAKIKGIDIETTNQETYAYHFTRILDKHAVDEIHERARQVGIGIRKITEVLAGLVNTDQESANILLRNGEVKTVAEIVSTIKIAGIALVNQGELCLVNNLLSHIPGTFRDDAEFSVAYAYTKLNVGEIMDAASWLPKGRKREKLPAEKKMLAEFIDIGIQNSMGKISLDTFLSEMTRIQEHSPHSLLGKQLKLERDRRLVFQKKCTPAEIEAFLKSAEELKSEPNLDPFVILMTDMAIWEFKGYGLIGKFSETIAKFKIAETMGMLPSVEKRIETVRNFMSTAQQWLSDYVDLEKRASNNRLVKGQLFITHVALRLLMIATARALVPDADGGAQETSQLEKIYDLLENNVKVFFVLRLDLYALHAKLLQADILVALGHDSKVELKLKEIKDVAEETGLEEFLNTAISFEAGNNIFTVIENAKAVISDSDNVVEPTYTDEDVERAALLTLESLNLPIERLPNLLKAGSWIQMDEQLRKSFCGNIETLEDLTHAKTQTTMYAVDPQRKICCKLFRHISPQSGTDREKLIEEFKNRFCGGCTKRNCH